MKYKLIVFTQVFTLIILYSNSIYADQGAGRTGAFLRFGVGARAMSMGNAFTGLADDPTAIYWNPAGLAQIKTIQLNLHYSNLPFDRTFHFIGAAMPTNWIGTFGLGWIGYRVNNLEARTSNTLAPDYFFTNAENAIMVSFSKKINNLFSIGGNIKWITHSLDNQTASGFGFDAGMLFKPKRNLKIGFMIQDIATQKKWKNGFNDVFPQTLRLGASYQWTTELLFTSEIENRWDSHLINHIGIEIKPIKQLSLLFGFDGKKFTSGTNLQIPLQKFDLKLSYGLMNDEIENFMIHSLSLNLSSHRKQHSNARVFIGKQVLSPVKKKVEIIEIIVAVLNVRTGPGIQYPAITTVNRGRRFKILTKAKNWIKIKLSENKHGWISAKFVRSI